MLMAGVHGDEALGVKTARRFLYAAKALKASDFPERVVVIPCANPDGFSAHTRQNAHGVDINRNFPRKTSARGRSPGVTMVGPVRLRSLRRER